MKDIYSHRAIANKHNMDGFLPQSKELLRPGVAAEDAGVEVDISSNGLVGHVKDFSQITGSTYDEMQGKFESMDKDELNMPALKEVLWLNSRQGRDTMIEIKGSSPEAAVEAAKLAFHEAESTLYKLSQHNLDTASVTDREDSPFAFQTFSVEALDVLKQARDHTDTPQLKNTPLALLATSKKDNVHDMSMSATILDRMSEHSIDTDGDWGEAVLELADREGYDMICPHWSVIKGSPTLVESAHEKGIKVGAWVVPRDEMELLRDLGVDAIISEEVK